MINVSCGSGSTGRICTDIAQALEKRGHTVKIAYGRGDVPDQFQKYAVRIATELSVDLDAIKTRLFDSAGFNSKRDTVKFIEWIIKYNPDVIHLHNLHGYYINIKILFNYLKTCGKKILWTLHDCWSFTGHSAYCDAINCTRWEKDCFRCPQTRSYPCTLVDRSKRNLTLKKKTFTNIENLTIVTPSQWLKNMVGRSFLKDYPVKVIHNGINREIFIYRDSNLRKKYDLKDKLVVMSVAASWDQMKGLNDYLELSNVLEDNIKMVLIGLTKHQLRTISPNIIGIQRTSNQIELAEWYSVADVFLNLTYCDTYPTVNIEAISCGTPVVTYNTGGSPESMYGYGVVINKGDKEKVRDVLTNWKMIKKKISPISRPTLDSLDRNNCLEPYIRLFEKI